METDILLTHDVCGPGTIGVFKREFGKNARVWNPYKIVIMPDHYIFTSDSLSNRNVDILRAFAKEQGLPYFYDVIDDPNGNWKFDPLKGPLRRQYGRHYAGVCHTALPEKGHVRPGEVLFGTDSHTCTAGAFNQFATGIGNTDAGFVMGTGKLLIKVPPTIQFYLDGELPKGVMAKDLILYIIGEIGFDGATYMAMQFEGPGAFSLSIEDRMTMANMAIEAGAKNGIFPADQKTIDYVNQRILKNGTKKEFEIVELEKNQKFFASYSIDLSKIEPTVAAPPNPANRFKAKELASVKIDRAYLGSCTGGKLTDFIAFASILKNNTVSVETFAVPSTPEIVDQLHKIEMEGQSLWEILVQAGVKITENPSCAACLGDQWTPLGGLISRWCVFLRQTEIFLGGWEIKLPLFIWLLQ
nr:aconitase family protein [Methylacidiphilum kamchatkense]